MKRVNLRENAPVGSFEFIRDRINEDFKKSINDIFPGIESYAYSIMYIYPEYIICDVRGKYFEVPYQFSIDFKASFGKPVEVEQYYAVKESVTPSKKKTITEELKESNIHRTKEAKEMDIDIDFMRLREGSFNAETGEVEVVLIEAGTNSQKKRHYPDSVIEESARDFTGLKMYINHPTTVQERERPERDLRDWVSTIVESYPGKSSNGRTQAVGKIAVHDSWLRERLKDSVFRDHIGLSINTGGKVSYGKVNGEEMQIVEKIILTKQNGPASVDWVTEAGARGRVSRLLRESQTNFKENKMELKEATFEDVKKENPQLIESIKAAVIKDLKESGEAKKKEEELKEANAKISEFERKEKLSAQKEIVQSVLKESKLPDAAKTRIEKEFSSTIVEDQTKLKESLAGRIKEEVEYINKFSSKGKISTTQSEGNVGLTESIQTELERRMGITTKEKK